MNQGSLTLSRSSEKGERTMIKTYDAAELIKAGMTAMQEQRRKLHNPSLTKEQTIQAVDHLIEQAKFDRRKGSIRVYSDYKQAMNKLVGWNAEVPYFMESHDYEAAMSRLVRALEVDDDYGFFRQHRESELSESYLKQLQGET